MFNTYYNTLLFWERALKIKLIVDESGFVLNSDIMKKLKPYSNRIDMRLQNFLGGLYFCAIGAVEGFKPTNVAHSSRINDAIKDCLGLNLEGNKLTITEINQKHGINNHIMGLIMPQFIKSVREGYLLKFKDILKEKYIL